MVETRLYHCHFIVSFVTKQQTRTGTALEYISDYATGEESLPVQSIVILLSLL
jgi:hypothetical protein